MTADPTSNELSTSAGRGPWWWVPSLYFAQGVPYVVVMTVAVIMFKRLGVGNAQIALYTSWLYLPYAIKPLWSPLVQRIGTRRGWVVVMQLVVAAGLACTAFAVPLDSFLRWSLVALASVAICSATHDIAADGFYLLALTSHQQAWFVGIRSTAYRMAMIAGQGLLVMLAGTLESATGLPVIEVQVHASDQEPTALRFAPEEFKVADSANAQHIVPALQKTEISVRGQQKSDVNALKDRCGSGTWTTVSIRPPGADQNGKARVAAATGRLHSPPIRSYERRCRTGERPNWRRGRGADAALQSRAARRAADRTIRPAGGRQ